MLDAMDQAEFDKRMMDEALREAHRAADEKEVPVGAILVYEGRILARGHNQVERLQDATAHAEILCLTSASAALSNWRLQGCTLYCTLEPCAMCFGAMILSRIDRLVYGAPDKRQGVCGSWTDLLHAKHPIHQFPVEGGLQSEESAQLMVQFFRERRQQGSRDD